MFRLVPEVRLKVELPKLRAAWVIDKKVAAASQKFAALENSNWY